MRPHKILLVALVALFILSLGWGSVAAQDDSPDTPSAALGTGFTYQGLLKDSGGKPTTATCAFQFTLWDALTSGTQIGSASTVTGVSVANGIFTAQVNATGEFGTSAFTGSARWLEVGVKCGSDTDYTTLTPRQPLTAAPYASYALAAAGAPWSGLISVPAGFADNVDNDTTYSAGTGLTLSSSSFSLTAAYRLPQGCSAGQIPEWNNTSGIWACGNDDVGSGGGGGDITGVTAGDGLSGGGSSGDVTLNANFGGSGSATTLARSDHNHTGVYASSSHTHAGEDITSGTVADARIASSLTRDSEVMSIVLANDGAGSGLDADLLDGQHASSFRQHYQNVLVVAKSGGDFTTITDALNSITTASATNPFLIYVAPGVYTETVTMKPYVDIEGSGEDVTTITSVASGTHIGTVVGADNAELRFLTVQSTGGAYTALYNYSQSPRLTHVIVRVVGGNGSTAYGVYNYYSLSTLVDVRIDVSGGITSTNRGLYNEGAEPTLEDVSVTVSGGSTSTNRGVDSAYDSTPRMRDMNITVSGGSGSTNVGVFNTISHKETQMQNLAIVVTSSGSNTGVANEYSGNFSITDSTIYVEGGSANCGIWNRESSPVLANLVISVTSSIAGSQNTGVYAYTNSNLTLTDVAVTVSTGSSSNNTGVYAYSNSNLTLTDVTVTVSGGSSGLNAGLQDVESSATIRNSTLRASGGTSYGVYHSGDCSGPITITINNSQIVGATRTIDGCSGLTVRVGASLLDGGAVNAWGGTITCAGVYDENYTFSGDTCP